MPRKNLLSESLAGLKGSTKAATKAKPAKGGKGAQTTATATAEAIESRRGKSSDPAFIGINCYVKKETLLAVKGALLGEAADTSDLIQHLLAEWVKARQQLNRHKEAKKAKAAANTDEIEAAEGITTGISAYDRAHTVRTAVAPNARPDHLRQPGHIFPVMAQPGGVLTRAGHTEAGCDLARLAGLEPAAVIVEIMNDDGTMARLPELQVFAQQHGLKIGTIADLIHHRSRNESLVEKIGERPLQTAYGAFTAHAFRDKTSQSVHLALVKGSWDASDTVPVRVHEPLSVLDALEIRRSMHSWGLDTSLQYLDSQGKGVAVLLNCGESSERLLEQFEGTARAAQAPERGRMDLRTYGIGAQILRECGVHKMRLMGNPRRMPSTVSYTHLTLPTNREV